MQCSLQVSNLACSLVMQNSCAQNLKLFPIILKDMKRYYKNQPIVLDSEGCILFVRKLIVAKAEKISCVVKYLVFTPETNAFGSHLRSS